MKNFYAIPSGVAFLDALAEGLWQRGGGDVFRLSESLILLPTRRSCRALREAFLRRADMRAALLPRMQPLGDIDEDEFYFASETFDPDIPPAIAPLRRRLLLTRLIAAKNEDMPLDQAAQLAAALAQFLDQAQIDGCDFGKLESLVREKDLARHWQETVRFLDILTKAWPEILAEEGCIDPAERRNRVLAAQAALWRGKPPAHPVIAAGSTGTLPATAGLLDVIAAMPLGAVILPGLDPECGEEAWQAIDETHPQFSMKALLEKCKVERTDVKEWNASFLPSPRGRGRGWGDNVGIGVAGLKTVDDSAEPRSPLPNPPRKGEGTRAARTRLLREAMRPAAVTEAWRNLKPDAIPRDALAGLARLDCDHAQEEAQVIALMLRAALETPGKTAALVTPDRLLAERVAAMLTRWGIEADDSAGSLLAAQPTGVFLRAVLAAASPHATAVDSLSLLKHPLAACGLTTAECRARARQMEMSVWRSEMPEPSDWLDRLERQFEPLTAAWNKRLPLGARIAAHIDLATQLAVTDRETGDARLWRGEAGEAAAAWLDDWQKAAAGFPALTGDEYMGLFGELAAAVTVRPAYGRHPRLSILGPLEARLIQADLVILGGLNEGAWPPEAAIDPWMSRPMKKDFGLASPERRIGLSAHDFVQLASAPEVVLTRARREGNAPTVPSRFLLQLDAVLRALGHSDDAHDALAPDEPWREWARLLDAPERIEVCAKPEPRPPAADRPDSLSVTEIGAWRRNPYAIYAKHILKLNKLEPLEAEIDAADRGTMIHKALDLFVRKYPDILPADALQALHAIGREVFSAYDAYPEVKAFWWPRFERIAAWFVEEESTRRADGVKVVQTEATGRIALGIFTLKGRADRIDRLPDGTVAITDYKTGGAPSQKEVESGYEPQLPLLALIARQGGFEGVSAGPVNELAYWKLGGSRGGGDMQMIKGNIDNLAAEAAAGLERLIETFSDPATPYQAVPKPDAAPRYNDYAHLARLAEWGRTEKDE